MKKNFINFICLTAGLAFLFTSQLFAQKGFDNQSTNAVSKHIKVGKTVFSPQEQIEIEYFNMPGNSQDWISLVEKSKPDNTFGQWFYTQGKTTGKFTFANVPVGEYEIRVYYKWPEGQYEVKDRLAIIIKNELPDNTVIDSYYFKTRKVHSVNQNITIEYKNLPGNAQDWITLVEANKPDNSFGQWFYTQGKKSGTHTFTAVPAGTYELRLYFNWPQGQYEVKARETIIVK
ncbi:MAG: hypothetical protein SNJ71_06375 [Bacteroidales bacterium]